MTPAEARANLRTVEEIAELVANVRTEIVSRYLDKCPPKYQPYVQSLMALVDDAAADFRADAVFTAKCAVEDIEQAQADEDREMLHREHMARVL